MNILLATMYSFPQAGGLGSYIRELAHELQQRGHLVEILACHPDFSGYYTVYNYKLVETKHVRTEEFYRAHPELTPGNSVLDPWIKEREIERHTFETAARAFDLTGYDMIHTNDVISTRVLSELTEGRTPVVQTVHDSITHRLMLDQGSSINGTPIWRYAVEMERTGVLASRATIVPSQWLKQLIIRNVGVVADQVYVIPNGINVDAFLRKMERETSTLCEPHKHVITCIGHLTELKGQNYLLQALSRLKNRRSDWTCWLIGEGPAKEELEYLSNRLGLQRNVVFFGRRDDIPALLHKTDVFVLPSLTENFPYSILEAQVAGTAVIASNVGGIPEIIQHGVTGFLVPIKDMKTLYITLAHALEDQALRKQIKANCVQTCRTKWSSSTMVDHIYEIYVKTLSRNSERVF